MKFLRTIYIPGSFHDDYEICQGAKIATKNEIMNLIYRDFEREMIVRRVIKVQTKQGTMYSTEIPSKV